MQKYLHGAFVLNLIQLFQSEDLRERDYLKTILHRIYGRFMPLRQQIRTEIANECYRYVYGSSRCVHGIAEFLDIFSSIINGFSIPVKEEHKAFLRNVLLPLHKCDKYEVYFQQLADCCVLFVNKEQNIAATVLGGLLRFWPKLSPTKQAFYLREMLNVIGALVEHENGFSYPKYKEIITLSINKIFECMLSSHFQVADQALSLWKDTVMLYLSKCNKEIIWNQLYLIFNQIIINHWNPGIKQLANEVILYYERIDFEYWKKLKQQYSNNTIIKEQHQQKQKDIDLKMEQRNNKYKIIQQIATKNKNKIQINGHHKNVNIENNDDKKEKLENDKNVNIENIDDKKENEDSKKDENTENKEDKNEKAELQEMEKNNDDKKEEEVMNGTNIKSEENDNDNADNIESQTMDNNDNDDEKQNEDTEKAENAENKDEEVPNGANIKSEEDNNENIELQAMENNDDKKENGDTQKTETNDNEDTLNGIIINKEEETT